MNRFEFEQRCVALGRHPIAGLDEAGRGPLAGPVVAAAVILPRAWMETGLPSELEGLNDSKQLSAARRRAFFECLTRLQEVCSSVAQLEAAEIDRLNILRATHAAMAAAVSRLQPPPKHVLVDGLPIPSLPVPHTAIVRGDARSYSIAAASIIAKVSRDRQMIEFDRLYPEYGFAQHKGYGTPEHLAALAKHGPCPIHRRSFAPLKLQQGELFPPPR